MDVDAVRKSLQAGVAEVTPNSYEAPTCHLDRGHLRSSTTVIAYVAFGVLALVSASLGRAQESRVSIERDTTRGSNAAYKELSADQDNCRRQCAVDNQCQAFTFRHNPPFCWLKTQTGTPTTDTGYVSGVKGGWPDLSIVTVNMLGHTTCCNDACYVAASCNPGTGPASVDWSVRADRLADAIASLGPDRRPDIISLTEVEGWRWCSPGTGATVGDYDMIDRLVVRLRNRTSVPYRIAYMVGNRGTFGAFSQCRYFTGDAVLYNSRRLINRNPDDVIRFPTLGTQRYDNATQGFQLRRSLPMCRSGSAQATTRALIDGAPQNDDCNVFVPSGPAWTWILAMDSPYSPPPMTTPVSLARFSFRHDQRSSFDFITVHPRAAYEEFALNHAINPFLAVASGPTWRVDRAFYPPILVGDVNSAAADIKSIPNFIEVHKFDGDVMTVRRGNLGFYSALNDYRTLERRVIPHSQANFFSDHVGLFVRLGWVDPNYYASATKIADLPNGTVVGEEEGGHWHCCWLIAGGAKFGIPDSETHGRLYGGRSKSLPPASLDAIGQVPLDGTVLREEAGPLWVMAGGAKFRAPDEATLARLYPGARAVPVWNHAVDSIPNVPAERALLREENGTIWAIIGGAKVRVPNASIARRFHPDARLLPLWSGALDGITSTPADGTLLREESSSRVYEIRGGRRHRVTGLIASQVEVVWDGALQAFPCRLPSPAGVC